MYKLKTTAGFGAGGTRNYENMENKPQINGVELVGNKSSNDLGLQPAGEYLTVETDPIFNASPAKNITNQNISNWNAKAEVSDIPTKVSQLQNDSAFIDKNVNNLTNYTLATGTGSTIELSINSSTYVMTMNLKNSAGTVISTGSVDLPLESVVVSGSYDSTNKKIILTLQSGSTIEIPVGDLVSGLQPEITSNNKLSSDLVDDTNKTNKFVSASEKTTWNAKYDKPSGGIPSTDMSSAVQTSLGKADTALQEHQDISGKEDKTNKVTSISSASTDTQYPSAKCVYDSQEEQNGLIDNALSIYNALPKVSGTGEEITLNDTAECWIPEIELKGNTKQASTSISGGDEYDSPSPEHPQDIHVVTGDNEIVVQNKNLAYFGWEQDFINRVNDNTKAKLETYNNRNCLAYSPDVGADDYDNKYVFKIPFKENTRYTFIYDKYSSSTWGDMDITYTDGTKQELGQTLTADTWNHVKFTSQANKTIKYLSTHWRNNALQYIDLDTFMVYEGIEDTTYVEHKEQTYDLTLGNLEVCKIGDYEDKFIKATNETGLTPDKWYLKKNIGKVVLNGSEDISIYVTPDETRRIFAISNILNGAESYTSHFDIPRLLSNYFYAVSQNVTWPAGAMSRRKQAQYDLYISVSDNPSVEELQSWLENNNVEVYYILATPTYILLNDTLQSELEAIKNVMSYQDQTNISQVNDDAPFNIKLSAVYDLNKLVSRVATLETE